MTAATVEKKKCVRAGCNVEFGPKTGQSVASWARQKFCSGLCSGHGHVGHSEKARVSAWVGVSKNYFLENGPGDLSWQQEAACRWHDPELWFPVGTSGPSVEQAEAAKEICRGCPVLLSCAKWAMESLETGIAGALDEAERRVLRAAA